MLSVAILVIPVDGSTALVNGGRSNRGLSVQPHHMRGGKLYSHKKPSEREHDQFGAASIPDGVFVPRNPDPQVNEVPAVTRTAAAPSPRVTASFPFNTAGVAPTKGHPVDPSVASTGDRVVYATNEFIAFSMDGGATFKSYNPASFYADSPDGGVCCDQIVQYSSKINRFIWLNQYWEAPGTLINRYRLAVFRPSAITSKGLSSWDYWDIRAAAMPGTKSFLDFPDMALGERFMYLSANAGDVKGKVSQSFIARISLENLYLRMDLSAGAEPWRYINGPLFFGRVVQNTGDRAYWAKNTDTSHLYVQYWDEASTSYSGKIPITIGSWPNTDYATTTPDSTQWLYTYGGRILAGTRAGQTGNTLYLAWTAARGSGQLAWLSQPHIELVAIDLPGITLAGQRAIWNPSIAFAYPNLTRNGDGDLGIAMAAGGGCCYVNFDVGNLTTSPYLVFTTTSSDANCGCGRWGDYVAIRPADSSTGFSAAGYGTNAVAAGGTSYDPHYVRFTISP